MKLWMLPWLFPLGLLATVVSVTVLGLFLVAGGLLLAVLLGSIVFPPRDDDDRDPDTHYWRLRDWTDRRG
ncbi:MAG: hypothetical protein WAL38_06705 [Solirubrobacteraceae bacterium]